jgi:hypothetical protein
MNFKRIATILVAFIAMAGCSGGNGDDDTNIDPQPVIIPDSGTDSGTGGSSGLGGSSGTGGNSGTGGTSGTSGTGGNVPDAQPDNATPETGASGTGGGPTGGGGSGGTGGTGGTGATPAGGGGTGGTGGSGGTTGGSGGTDGGKDAADVNVDVIVTPDVTVNDADAGTPDSNPPADAGPDSVTPDVIVTPDSPADGGDGGADAEPMLPFNCSGWTRSNVPSSAANGEGLDESKEIICFASNDCYMGAVKHAHTGDAGQIVEQTGEVAHFDGSAWTLMQMPTTAAPISNMFSVWGSSANDVWIGGATKPGVAKGLLLHRANGGALTEDTNLVLAFGDTGVRSIWGSDASNVFILVDSFYGTDMSDSKIFRKIGSSWDQMTLPMHSAPIMMSQIWGTSATDVYAVGTAVDSNKNAIAAILWHFDGNTWTSIATLPSEVKVIAGINGTGPTAITVVGSTSYWTDASPYPDLHGVILQTTDLIHWTKNESSGIQGNGRVWTPRKGAALVGGSYPTPPIFGAGYLSTQSLGTWVETHFDSIAEGFSGIAPIPGTNAVMLATHAETGWVGVYTGTCQ